jgi:hypothetical protein
MCIADRGVTTVSDLERGQPGRLPDQQATSLIEEYRFALLQSFCEVFCVDFVVQRKSFEAEMTGALTSNTTP